MSYLTFRVPRTGLEPARLAALAPKRARLPFRHLGLHKLFGSFAMQSYNIFSE